MQILAISVFKVLNDMYNYISLVSMSYENKRQNKQNYLMVGFEWNEEIKERLKILCIYTRASCNRDLNFNLLSGSQIPYMGYKLCVNIWLRLGLICILDIAWPPNIRLRSRSQKIAWYEKHKSFKLIERKLNNFHIYVDSNNRWDERKFSLIASEKLNKIKSNGDEGVLWNWSFTNHQMQWATILHRMHILNTMD